MMGRHEEAMAAQQQVLLRTPDHLHAHVHLAHIYSDLGREEEARAAAAEVLRLNPNFSLEAGRQIYPFKDPAVIEHGIAALRKLGLK